MKKIVLVTGGFDPIHRGHLQYLREAARLGDELVVGINSDQWLRRKKGREFMGWQERAEIIGDLKYVTRVIAFDDSDGTAGDAIRQVYAFYGSGIQLVFANGGDRSSGNVPEQAADYSPHRPEFVFGVGGEEKLNSSSWLLANWHTPFILRPWGSYRTIFECPGVKVKELVVKPGETLSMQRHRHRAEHWFVAEGCATVRLFKNENEGMVEQHLCVKSSVFIDCHQWHQLFNPYHDVCRILEVQVGNICIEEDIERL